MSTSKFKGNYGPLQTLQKHDRHNRFFLQEGKGKIVHMFHQYAMKTCRGMEV
jgi:hypothetical protein